MYCGEECVLSDDDEDFNADSEACCRDCPYFEEMHGIEYDDYNEDE